MQNQKAENERKCVILFAYQRMRYAPMPKTSFFPMSKRPVKLFGQVTRLSSTLYNVFCQNGFNYAFCYVTKVLEQY